MLRNARACMDVLLDRAIHSSASLLTTSRTAFLEKMLLHPDMCVAYVFSC